MPIKKKPSEVLFSKEINAPNGQRTLGIFARDDITGKVRFIEPRICEKKNGKFKCPKKSTQTAKRKALAKKLGFE